LPRACVLVVLFLISAAPTGAALPEDGARACQALGEVDLIYVGQARAALPYQPHGAELEKAKLAFLEVEREHERPPDDAEIKFEVRFRVGPVGSVEIALRSADIDAMNPRHVSRGSPAGESFTIVANGAVEAGRSYVFYGRTADPELALSIYQSHGSPAPLDHARQSVPIVVGDATEHDGVEFQRVR
jgi:hypothetical protein